MFAYSSVSNYYDSANHIDTIYLFVYLLDVLYQFCSFQDNGKSITLSVATYTVIKNVVMHVNICVISVKQEQSHLSLLFQCVVLSDTSRTSCEYQYVRNQLVLHRINQNPKKLKERLSVKMRLKTWEVQSDIDTAD